MKVRVELNEGDISDAIKRHVRDKMNMAPSGQVTLTGSPDDRNGPMVYSASVMAEPIEKGE